ncbi:Hypothetical predicted protein, partial [Scomber scombrus]
LSMWYPAWLNLNILALVLLLFWKTSCFVSASDPPYLPSCYTQPAVESCSRECRGAWKAVLVGLLLRTRLLQPPVGPSVPEVQVYGSESRKVKIEAGSKKSISLV